MELENQPIVSNEENDQTLPPARPKRQGIQWPLASREHPRVEAIEKKWRLIIHISHQNKGTKHFKKLIDNHELDYCLNLYRAGKLLGVDNGNNGAYYIINNKVQYSEHGTLPVGFQIVCFDKTIDIPPRGWPAREIPNLGNMWREFLHIMINLFESETAFRKIIVGASLKIQKVGNTSARQRISVLLARRRNIGFCDKLKKTLIDDFFMQTGIVTPNDDHPMTYNPCLSNEVRRGELE